MTKPLLQMALDASDLTSALTSVEPVADLLDVIEVGTILAFAHGLDSVEVLRHTYPNHTLVCDMKVTDASAILTQLAMAAGADWVTVSAAAHRETIRAAKQVTDACHGDVQIELYGHWTLDDARAWVDMGITQAIYHRSRDAELAGINWTQDDLDKMHHLSDLGIELSITGGIVPDDLHLFKPLSVKAFIAGRALAGHTGRKVAESFREEIGKHW
ncbi:3-keto-L-gulonate-6-phosphate decarboxylase UlaD [Vibrio nigripulchritudo]|uniref:3-keto-L-gulonate-6-phosphate decarboxylase UlaD n=1 Tax=Vibrio nigripulchritudo TaxID=28173 RepID=UPI0003B19E8A|nr:3-keto-L-gulonate-6-phosphate decarboxylase UlaD [Vibrio nigripulchritudo]CCN86030.1 3-keto-L-gulonate 6-phosphate decarboxylase [Vibrio nigripulchritudo BLFn1]CCN97828.1 3-keto-L-gulonate 6-phosphate decarboxylase [Vibrio nigripulchritudo ENn2]CCO56139.1 3-keto-L-gulonate 6-phosphate decarboxylase [Vibrio nigripulchritudo Wn13]